MGKETAFIGVGSSISFWHSAEAVYCYSCVFNLEKLLGNENINVHSLLTFFEIDSNKVKSTRTRDFYETPNQDVSQLIEEYKYAKELYLKYKNETVEDLTKELISENSP